jgi:hypothetical protein
MVSASPSQENGKQAAPDIPGWRMTGSSYLQALFLENLSTKLNSPFPGFVAGAYSDLSALYIASWWIPDQLIQFFQILVLFVLEVPSPTCDTPVLQERSRRAEGIGNRVLSGNSSQYLVNDLCQTHRELAPLRPLQWNQRTYPPRVGLAI